MRACFPRNFHRHPLVKELQQVIRNEDLKRHERFKYVVRLALEKQCTDYLENCTVYGKLESEFTVFMLGQSIRINSKQHRKETTVLQALEEHASYMFFATTCKELMQQLLHDTSQAGFEFGQASQLFVSEVMQLKKSANSRERLDDVLNYLKDLVLLSKYRFELSSK